MGWHVRPQGMPLARAQPHSVLVKSKAGVQELGWAGRVAHSCLSLGMNEGAPPAPLWIWEVLLCCFSCLSAHCQAWRYQISPWDSFFPQYFQPGQGSRGSVLSAAFLG